MTENKSRSQLPYFLSSPPQTSLKHLGLNKIWHGFFTTSPISNNNTHTIHNKYYVFRNNQSKIKHCISFDWRYCSWARYNTITVMTRKWVIESLASKYLTARRRQRYAMYNHQTIFIGCKDTISLKAFARNYLGTIILPINYRSKYNCIDN